MIKTYQTSSLRLPDYNKCTFRMLGYSTGKHTMRSYFGLVPSDFGMDDVSNVKHFMFGLCLVLNLSCSWLYYNEGIFQKLFTVTQISSGQLNIVRTFVHCVLFYLGELQRQWNRYQGLSTHHTGQLWHLWGPWGHLFWERIFNWRYLLVSQIFMNIPTCRKYLATHHNTRVFPHLVSSSNYLSIE